MLIWGQQHLLLLLFHHGPWAILVDLMLLTHINIQEAADGLLLHYDHPLELLQPGVEFLLALSMFLEQTFLSVS